MFYNTELAILSVRTLTVRSIWPVIVLGYHPVPCCDITLTDCKTFAPPHSFTWSVLQGLSLAGRGKVSTIFNAHSHSQDSFPRFSLALDANMLKISLIICQAKICLLFLLYPKISLNTKYVAFLHIFIGNFSFTFVNCLFPLSPGCGLLQILCSLKMDTLTNKDLLYSTGKSV